jgi:hypothetical protein
MLFDKILSYMSDAIIAFVGLTYTQLLGFILSFAICFVTKQTDEINQEPLKYLLYFLCLLPLLPAIILVFFIGLNQLLNQARHKRRCISIVGMIDGLIYLLRLKFGLSEAKFGTIEHFTGAGIFIMLYILLFFMMLQESRT